MPVLIFDMFKNENKINNSSVPENCWTLVAVRSPVQAATCDSQYIYNTVAKRSANYGISQ